MEKGSRLGDVGWTISSPYTIKLYSEKSQRITIQTFDLVGRELHDLEIKYIKAGNTQLQWNGSNYVSGIYFLKISSPSTHIFKKVVLVK